MTTAVQEDVPHHALGEDVAGTTRRILAMRDSEAAALAARCSAYVLPRIRSPRLVRLRDLTTILWAEFYYEVVFGERCPPQARALVVRNAADATHPPGPLGGRSRHRHEHLARFLVDRLDAGDVPHELPPGLPTVGRATYLLDTFFERALVESSEAMTHVLMQLAHSPELQDKAGQDEDYLMRVVEAALRRHPFFAPTEGTPMQGAIAPIALQVAVRETLSRLALRTSAPPPATGGGRCLLLPRAQPCGRCRARHAYMWLQNGWEDVAHRAPRRPSSRLHA